MKSIPTELRGAPLRQSPPFLQEVILFTFPIEKDAHASALFCRLLCPETPGRHKYGRYEKEMVRLAPIIHASSGP